MTETATDQTRRFLHGEFLWPGASLELDDVQHLHGGRRIIVTGTGHTTVQLVFPGQQEKRYAFRLSWPEVRRLLALCVEQDLLTIEPRRRAGLPDEAQPVIRLTSIYGMERQVRKWAAVEDVRFDAIYAALRQLEDRTKHLEPVYNGPRRYDYFKPSQGWSKLNIVLRRKIEGLKYLKYWRPKALLEPLRDFGVILAAQWPLFVIAALFLLIAYFGVIIEPDRRYGFGGGLLHGAFWYQNVILAEFIERAATAPLHSGLGYRLGFILGLVLFPLAVKVGLEVLVALWRKR